ncbi:universal stress protein [Candidatus Nitrosocosmicus hydrocola]|uniref:universal stress protein n=1 Tax=Candidatus Nitrosocosmicus hydrocola TaxID=1826872 RepID=UPI0011E601B9|nr:universal stress protein [Candidatus Nitrosocosmicus hydrocola]
MFPDPTESISEFVLPSYKKILVTHDGKDRSNKAINHAVFLSKLSGAEIVILQIVDDAEELGGASVKISNNQELSLSATTSTISESSKSEKDIAGSLINSMEEKIKKIEQAGCNNKVSYKFKTGKVIDEIVNETNQTNYDLIVMTSFHLNSWLGALFSNTRKIISNVNTSVLIPQ